MTQNNLNPRDEIANELERAAQSIHPNPAFQAELEDKLKAAHKPKHGFAFPSFRNIFPAIGGAMALAALAFALNWGIRNLAPLPPQPSSNATATPRSQEMPRPSGDTYDWNGTTLYLDVPFPELPNELPLYVAQGDQHATLESARALATQFGMNGQAYLIPSEIPGLADNDFLIVDGNQRLQVRSNKYFTYYPDYTLYLTSYNPMDYPNAEATIREFLPAKGFNFEYVIEPMGMPGTYNVKQLLPEGIALSYEYFSFSGLTFQFGANGIFAVYASLTQYSPVDEKAYRLITAQKAFERLFDTTGAAGYMIGQSSPYQPMRAWTRPRRENETVTVWGWMNSYSSAESNSPLVSLDGYTVSGSIADVPANMPNTFVEVTGQFASTDSAKIFNAESWKIYDGYEDGIFGALQRDGENVVIVTEAGTYILPDVPADVPLPMENAYVTGVSRGNVFEWKTLDDRLSFGGGGGGGGGLGLYKLNLSGTPVPFPTAGPAFPLGGSEAGYPYVVVAGDTCASISNMFMVDVETLITANGLAADCSNLMIDQTIIIPFTTAMPTERFDGQRGTLTITIYEQTDGSQRTVYGFITNNQDFPYLTLEGKGLENLMSNNGRPVDVWGTISYDPAVGVPALNVERYEVPFPDLQFQILKGIEESVELEGQTVLLFTTDDGKQYVELAPNCYDIIGAESVSGTGLEGESILLEALAIPDLTFGGYPAICVSVSALAIDPVSGKPTELTISADQPSILPEPPSAAAGTLPTLTIEKVELVYYMPNQRYLTTPGASPVYIQPVWRFYGHYSDGTIFEALIQALDPIFLLPETEEPFSPG